MQNTQEKFEVIEAYANMVPDEYQILLNDIRGILSDTEWRTGEIALELYNLHYNRNQTIPQDERVTKARIQAHIAKFIGQSARTVRYYADVVRKVGHLRERYAGSEDALTFSFYALVSESRWGGMAEEMLDWAIEKQKTIAQVEAHFMPRLGMPDLMVGVDTEEGAEPVHIITYSTRPQLLDATVEALHSFGISRTRSREALKKLLDITE